MEKDLARRSEGERVCALFLAALTLLLVLFQVSSLIASYLPTGSYLSTSHNYIVLVILPGCFAACLYLLRTSRAELRRPLPVATLTGLLLGLLLGWLANLPNYMVLILLFGPLGPFAARESIGDGSSSSGVFHLNFWLSLLCLLLSLGFSMLVAFSVVRSGGRTRDGIGGALLMACIAVLVSIFTLALIVIVPELLAPVAGMPPGISYTYSLAQFQDIAALMLLLIGGQAVQASLGGWIGASLAQRARRTGTSIKDMQA